MQACQVYTQPNDTAVRLAELKVSEAALREAVNQGHLQRTRLTPNHPRIFPGLEMWGWTVASLRNQLSQYGWYAEEKSNYPLTAHREHNFVIAVASGDSYVGNPIGIPTTRSKKGKNTADAVEHNSQIDMFAELLPEPSDSLNVLIQDTWILLHYIDQVKKEIRIELSRPSGIDDSGKIIAWSERVILSSIDLDDDLPEIFFSGSGGPDIDIDIRRKSAS